MLRHERDTATALLSNKRKHFPCRMSVARPRLLAFQDVGARSAASQSAFQETSAKRSLSTPFINRAYPPSRFEGFILQL